jgi:hypothetical protein
MSLRKLRLVVKVCYHFKIVPNEKNMAITVRVKDVFCLQRLFFSHQRVHFLSKSESDRVEILFLNYFGNESNAVELF